MKKIVILGKRKVEKQDKGRGSASVSVRQLEDQNKQLADALNKIKSQNTILQNQIRDTRAKHLDLRVENANQRDEIRRLKVKQFLLFFRSFPIGIYILFAHLSWKSDSV